MAPKYAVIPFAGEIYVDLPEGFDGSPHDALTWWFDNMPQDFTIDEWLKSNGGEWDFYDHIHRGGGIWCAQTACDVQVEDQ